MECPEYRLRIFMSVDLVGSTAFKAGRGSETGKASPQPAWVREIRDFYALFPAMLQRRFAERVAMSKLQRDEAYPPPKLWKTVGDELIFCCRLKSLEHLAICVLAFVLTLEDYGTILDSRGNHLDVKGGAWLASFPFPNISVRIITIPVSTEAPDGTEDRTMDTSIADDLPTEELERNADEEPSEFDFLGPEIDSGFRVTKLSSADRCALSVELACLIAEACHDDKAFPLKFFYDDRQILRGVLRDRPYPLVSIDTERGPSRKDVLSKERTVTRRGTADSRDLYGFLVAFLNDERIELPALIGVGGKSIPAIPAFYKRFQNAWTVALEEAQKRRQAEDEAENSNGAASTSTAGEDVAENPKYKTVTESFAKFLRGLEEGKPSE